jgi:hypothetical protein
VLPSATLTPPAMTPPAQRMIRSSASQTTSPACLMGRSLRHISDSDVSENLSPENLSLRVVELENALCNQNKLVCKVFHENKKLNLELKSASSKIASL